MSPGATALQGLHTALVTPFGDDGSIDADAFARLCVRQLDAGIDGLVPCGTTGETPTLTDDEQDVLLRITLDVASGRAPVMAGIGDNSTRRVVANAARVQRLGVDTGLLVLPAYNKPNAAGLRAHVAEVARVGLPLVLYHVPGRTGQLVPAPLLAELAATPGVVGIKEATGDLRYGTALMARTDVPVLSGDDFSFLGLMAQGAVGCISVVTNVDPAGTVDVLRHHRAGDDARAAAALRRLWPLLEFLFADSNPVPCKAAVAALGLCGPAMRLPLAPWDGASPRPLLADLGLLG
ncbi:MAG: 4-hydroxy-tetrahydrodipicolinate synthase [Alphaproteobacteria bacterium]|nr:4-hydroxy-tetrahydrodipicolinate synthase [Alphaproteobacteria bacterium]